MINEQRASPVFLTGYMRSGTTLLGNIVDRHSSIAVFIESFFIPRYYFTQVMFWPLSRTPNFLRLARSIVDEPASKRNGMIIDESRILATTERNLPSLIDELFSEWARSRGKSQWADKSPGYISKISVLDRMFPHGRFVHIIRDGRDVWLSLKKLGWSSDVVDVATDWSNTVSKARQYGVTMADDRYLEVMYERLVASPEREMRRISDFLGVSYEPRMIQPDADGPGNPALVGWPKIDRAIDAENTMKWKAKLSKAEYAVFNFCARETLESLGYEVPIVECSRPPRSQIRVRRIRSRLRRPIEMTRQAARLFAKATLKRWS